MFFLSEPRGSFRAQYARQRAKETMLETGTTNKECRSTAARWQGHATTVKQLRTRPRTFGVYAFHCARCTYSCTPMVFLSTWPVLEQRERTRRSRKCAIRAAAFLRSQTCDECAAPTKGALLSAPPRCLWHSHVARMRLGKATLSPICERVQDFG